MTSLEVGDTSRHSVYWQGRGIAVAGIVGAAAISVLLLVPGMRLGVDQPWLGVVVLLAPTAAVLAVTGRLHYGPGRALLVALVVAVLSCCVSWLVALFALVRALSGVGVGLAWGVLLFLTPAVSVLALGLLALKMVAPQSKPRGPDRSRT